MKAKNTEAHLLHKLGIPCNGTTLPFYYSNVFAVQQVGEQKRLCVGIAQQHVALMLELIQTASAPFGILYVLHTPRCANEPLRYQSPPLGFTEARSFLTRFQDFFEHDARHDIWVRSRDDHSTIVYDRHQLIYVYSATEPCLNIMAKHQLQKKPGLLIPTPHVHNYHNQYDKDEETALKYFPWKTSPLHPSDIQVKGE